MKLKTSQFICSIFALGCFQVASSQKTIYDAGPIGAQGSVQSPVVALRTFVDADFRSKIDLTPLCIVTVTSVRTPEIEDPSNPNSRFVQVANAMVLDSYSLNKGTHIALADSFTGAEHPQPLKANQRYLVYIGAYHPAQSAGSLSGTPKGDFAGPQFFLEMAEPTESEQLPRGGTSGEVMVSALLDALDTATGRDALEIRRVIGFKVPGTEVPASWPDHPAPLSGPALRIAQIADKTHDPYVRLATRAMLADWSVVGSQESYLDALTQVSQVAPADFDGVQWAGIHGQASDPFFELPTGTPTHQFDRRKFIEAAVLAKSAGIQDLMLRCIGKDQLSSDQIHSLVGQLSMPFPFQLNGYVWQSHLATICLALDRNAGADQRLTDPVSALDPETGKFSLRKSIAHWVGTLSAPVQP